MSAKQDITKNSVATSESFVSEPQPEKHRRAGRACMDALTEIYRLVGDQPFTIAYLRQHGLPGNIQRLVNDGHIICVKRRSQSRPAVYQISDRNIRRFGADQICANPQMICDLRDGRVSLRALSRETGFSVDIVKKYTEHSP